MIGTDSGMGEAVLAKIMDDLITPIIFDFGKNKRISVEN